MSKPDPAAAKGHALGRLAARLPDFPAGYRDWHDAQDAQSQGQLDDLWAQIQADPDVKPDHRRADYARRTALLDYARAMGFPS